MGQASTYCQQFERVGPLSQCSDWSALACGGQATADGAATRRTAGTDCSSLMLAR
jgi:hypothetical protein